MSVDSVISWLAETTIAVSLLIVGVLLTRKIVARKFGAGAAYLLWLAPLARMLAPELKILPPPDRAPVAAATWIEAAPSAFVGAEPAGGAILNLPIAAASIWAAGALFFLAWQFYKQRRFINAATVRSQAAPPDLIAETEEIAARFGLRKAPPIRIAADATGPLVAGALRPLIILPADFASRYSPVERRLALAHECAHIRRGDLLATFAALLFRAAQWPNPLVHYAFSAFRADQESAC
ncbi:MAG: M56 family metallopeptidase, partial [Pseudomonadota bacterium]